jgi:hypothetical protein
MARAANLSLDGYIRASRVIGHQGPSYMRPDLQREAIEGRPTTWAWRFRMPRRLSNLHGAMAKLVLVALPVAPWEVLMAVRR